MKNLENSKKLDLKDFGVQELNVQEAENIEGGWPWDDLVDIFNLYIDNFDSDVLPTGTLGGYTGCKIII